MICGKKHYQRKCGWCDDMVWTQSREVGYVCHTCTEPKQQWTCF